MLRSGGAALLAVLAWAGWSALRSSALYRRVTVPPHLANHPAFGVDEVLSEGQAERLRQFMKDTGRISTNVDDTLAYDIVHEHIGEAVPFNGSCPHKYMVPSKARDACILPNRIDVGRHFILTGGPEGTKERFEPALQRLLSYGRFIFDPSELLVIQELFASNTFTAAAKRVCPPEQPVLEPFQFNIIVQVPGQSVAAHLDSVYFWGASRFEFPGWLLAVMAFSGVFQDEFVHQVQFVAYFHEEAPTSGGDFLYWPDDGAPPRAVSAHPRSGVVVDGSKTVHAASVYHPERLAPPVDKSQPPALVYEAATDRWHVTTPDGATVASYATRELRCSLVFRAKCFASEAEQQRFAAAPKLGLEEVLRRLSEELARRGKPVPEARLDLALALLDEFISYPYSYDARIPLNYCALGKLVPAIEPLLRAFC